MSIFKVVAQNTAFTLLESSSALNTFNMNVHTINITNTASTETFVDLHIEPLSGANHSVVSTAIPGRTTLIYDTPFTFPAGHILKITPSNTNSLHITIN